MATPQEPIRVWNYRLDSEGQLWHDGAVFDDPQVLSFFMKKMERLSDGRYFALCQGEECYFDPEDTVYVVQSLRPMPDRIELVFQGGYREDLDPATLHVGKDNVFYCRVRGGAFEARFNRKPYLELARQIDFDPAKKEYFLQLAGRRYPISGV